MKDITVTDLVANISFTDLISMRDYAKERYAKERAAYKYSIFEGSTNKWLHRIDVIEKAIEYQFEKCYRVIPKD